VQQGGNWSVPALQAAAQRIPAWQQGSVAQWIAESNLLARHAAYAPLSEFRCAQLPLQVQRIEPAYLDAGERVVAEQLLKAGARIAQVINSALDPDLAPPEPQLE
jgi:hypothetical protein